MRLFRRYAVCRVLARIDTLTDSPMHTEWRLRAGKLLSGVFFYPFFAVMPILLASHRWPGTGKFLRDMVYNRNGFWNALVRARFLST